MRPGHDHGHGQHTHEPRLAPSGEGTVVLDIGDGVGALVVHTPGAWNGIEIELAHRGENHQLVHTDVRERVLPGGSTYAGVFPAVPEGDYTLLRPADLPRAGTAPVDVTIRSGEVTEVVITP